MADIDTLDSLTKTDTTPDDFFPLLGKGISSVRFKFFFFLYLLFLLISSDVFVLRMLSKIDQATSLNNPTSYGKMLQGAVLVAGGLVIDGLISYDVV